MRDGFSASVKNTLADRVGNQCSNQACRQPTSGPQSDPTAAINVGVAAHITAAAPGGPRYDPLLTAEQRASHENGIWLCQVCAKLIDSDEPRYAVGILREWKRVAELAALNALERRRSANTEPDANLLKAERLVPKLLAEMRTDLAEFPLRREFVLLKRSWGYWAKGNELVYFYDEHPELDSAVQVLENLGLIREITYNNTKRFMMNEELVDYLTTTHGLTTQVPTGPSSVTTS